MHISNDLSIRMRCLPGYSRNYVWTSQPYRYCSRCGATDTAQNCCHDSVLHGNDMMLPYLGFHLSNPSTELVKGRFTIEPRQFRFAGNRPN